MAFSERAEKDLIDIWAFLAQTDDRNADRFVDALRKKTMQLAILPYSGRARSDLGEGLRSLSCDPYLIVYRVEFSRVEIIRYAHMRRDIKGLV